VRRTLAADEKPLHWVGSSKRDFLRFPAAVKDDMGNALGIAQWRNGSDRKALEGARPRRVGNRRIAQRERVSSHLHCPIREGRLRPPCVSEEVSFRYSTAKKDVDLVAERLKVATKDYEEHYGKPKR